MSADDGTGREVAYRVFATEFDDAAYSYSESDEERAPNYVVTPTGARVNRVFVVGVLTEVESVSEDVLRARVADATGAFVLYAGQYQPDEQAFLEAITPPAFLAVTGKARTFQPEDGDRVLSSVRPESLNEVDAETRDRWTVQAAEQTIERVGTAARAISTGLSGDELRARLREDGLDEHHTEGLVVALEQYDTTPSYLGALQDVALDAARVVTGDTGEARSLDRAPADAGDVTAADLVSETAEVTEVSRAQSTPDTDETPGTSETTGTGETPGTSETTGTGEATPDTDEMPGTGSTADTAEEPVTGTGTGGGAGGDDTGTDPSVDPGEFDPGEFDLEEETREEATDSDTGDGTGVTPANDDAATGTDGAADPGEFDPEEHSIDEQTREEIENSYGTDFQTGTEVDDPGEADIETPAPDDEAVESVSPTEQPGADGSDPEPTEQATDDETTAGGEKPDDPQDALLVVMEELDDGNGADREDLVDEMEARYEMTAGEVEDTVQDALMDGQCYEPNEDSLKPI